MASSKATKPMPMPMASFFCIVSPPCFARLAG
jgi:hypothetical protein